MNDAIYIGLDIGGTKIMAACMTSDGEIRRKVKVATPLRLQDGLNLTHELVQELAEGFTLQGIGVAIGGPIDLQAGTVSPLHQPEWRQVPLKTMLEEAWHCPCHIEVDTNVAALGEYYLGAFTEERFLYVTLSTGMGGGFLINGKIYRGKQQIHPEIGHQSIHFRCAHPERIRCECGVPDCLEAMVSGNGIERVYGKPADKLTAEQWDEVAWNLAQGMRNIATLLTPDIIVFGGGVSNGGGELWLKKVHTYTAQHLRLVPPPQMRLSILGNDTALSGACYIALHGLDHA